MNHFKNKSILLVDDEPQLLKMLETIFKKDGFNHIFCASTFTEAMSILTKNIPDIAILDVMLPDGDGFSLLNEIKRIRDIPVLFLTAKGEAEDKILGLGLGADDYVVKPFLPRELTLRLNTILKRTYSNSIKNEQSVINLAACTIDLSKAEVMRGKEVIQLTAKEHAILSLLYENSNTIVTLDMLCESAWEDDSYGYENTLMVHIRHIREKIEKNPSAPVSLVTVKGLGYRLVT
ncbi:DNA-binding response regulator, OmpR family, contains REC and winged-helix (wHTH) domain [Clostridium amylolyticum]|uniref:Stage 0 sporulation protein A homolog n=1 Tax=Clostridium amylolyticum TaxID=1121298 RepID=A0A1M6NJF2_9CLOT|nr:response regulator transcription factor [Clostridium amylolyticum]SHJ95776.1 DNA-binding response regulator, OmpR family, contains REC and winged-helix (wHTH) domain [Clostridium amylolyticum]